MLLRAREIAKLHGAVTRQGLTLVPLSIYFNSRGRAKVELALARGKKVHDKRETIKERDWKREQGRLHAPAWLSSRASGGGSWTAMPRRRTRCSKAAG